MNEQDAFHNALYQRSENNKKWGLLKAETVQGQSGANRAVRCRQDQKTQAKIKIWEITVTNKQLRKATDEKHRRIYLTENKHNVLK